MEGNGFWYGQSTGMIFRVDARSGKCSICLKWVNICFVNLEVACPLCDCKY